MPTTTPTTPMSLSAAGFIQALALEVTVIGRG
ncbi:hypothetical protein SAMN04488548_1199 [Gordonia westfalica]|uniref:Uncharacterized protein n=1 Tax=Gordonia westfalica TaxID=158898 RepID=A0A1H2DRK8_9ACTN|nr:hypothetical protein SAMN04488548_1199 [Gordonia westfalica]